MSDLELGEPLTVDQVNRLRSLLRQTRKAELAAGQDFAKVLGASDALRLFQYFDGRERDLQRRANRFENKLNKRNNLESSVQAVALMASEDRLREIAEHLEVFGLSSQK